MDNNQKATETNAATIAPQEGVVASIPTPEDAEARYKALEEEKENYKKAYLKLKEKPKPQEIIDEDEDERMRRIAEETLANSRLAEIAREQDSIIKKALKENSELKLAQLNKTNAPSAAIGSHSEATAVRDTLVTPEQEAAFRAKGWNDKDIERYKKNLRARM